MQRVADDHYNFLFIDVDGFSKQSDEGTLTASDLGRLLEQNKLNLLKTNFLPETNVIVPDIFIADEVYPMHKNIMKPFSKRKGDWICRRRILQTLIKRQENNRMTFRELFVKWRILSGYIETSPETVDDIITAACILHNIIFGKMGTAVQFGSKLHLFLQAVIYALEDLEMPVKIEQNTSEKV